MIRGKIAMYVVLTHVLHGNEKRQRKVITLSFRTFDDVTVVLIQRVVTSAIIMNLSLAFVVELITAAPNGMVFDGCTFETSRV